MFEFVVLLVCSLATVALALYAVVKIAIVWGDQYQDSLDLKHYREEHGMPEHSGVNTFFAVEQDSDMRMLAEEQRIAGKAPRALTRKDFVNEQKFREYSEYQDMLDAISLETDKRTALDRLDVNNLPRN